MEQTGKFSNGRAALGLLALVILAAAQLGAQLLASLPLMVGAPVWLGNVLAGVLYAALGVAGLLLLCGKGLRVTPEECRFAPVRLRPVWAASAVLMPALAAGALLCQPGHWQAGSAEDATAVAAGAVFFFGAGTGIVEEAVFRGVLMTAVERRWNKTAAARPLPGVCPAARPGAGAELCGHTAASCGGHCGGRSVLAGGL